MSDDDSTDPTRDQAGRDDRERAMSNDEVDQLITALKDPLYQQGYHTGYQAGLLAIPADPATESTAEYLRRVTKERNEARAALVDANLDREHADEMRAQANERADDYNEAHRKTLERTRRCAKERDRAVADVAALRGRMEALADELWNLTPDEAVLDIVGKLRAALDGGDSE